MLKSNVKWEDEEMESSITKDLEIWPQVQADTDPSWLWTVFSSVCVCSRNRAPVLPSLLCWRMRPSHPQPLGLLFLWVPVASELLVSVSLCLRMFPRIMEICFLTHIGEQMGGEE